MPWLTGAASRLMFMVMSLFSTTTATTTTRSGGTGVVRSQV